MEEELTKKEKKFDRKPVRPFPKHTLEKTLVIAKAIQDRNAGKPMKKLLVADAIGRKPTSPEFRDLLSSSFKYGLTMGTEKAESISLTTIGQELTKPSSLEMEIKNKQKAILHPELFKRIYTHFKDSKFQRTPFFENQLETQFGVPRGYVKEISEILESNGKYAGIIRDISGSNHIIFDDTAPIKQEGGEIDESEMAPEELLVKDEEKEPQEEKEEKQKPIFIGHGKNKKPIEQLKKILDQFKIPYKVAVEEAHTGRPIPQKVREIMEQCGSAIFVFSKEEEPKDEEAGQLPNLNVVFELGAASILYGDKIIIFKEGSVNLGSDFSDLGYISFEENSLEAKAMDLLKELFSMGFVKLVSN